MDLEREVKPVLDALHRGLQQQDDGRAVSQATVNAQLDREKADARTDQALGELFESGYITGPQTAHRRGPVSARLTSKGRELVGTGWPAEQQLAAKRREELTDATLGGVLPDRLQASMSESQRQAISAPLADLRAALDGERYSAAIGAAKDLTEAACKVAIERAGGTAPRNEKLQVLFKQTLAVTGVEKVEGDVGRSLAATVQRLAELRNAVGAGHGRASQPNVDGRRARLAATAAFGIALFVLAED